MANKSINLTGLEALIRKIKAAFFAKAEGVTTSTIGIDDSPTINSGNLVKSGGVYAAIQQGSGGGVPVEYTIPAGGMKADHLYYIETSSDINIDIEDKFDGYDHEWRLWLYVNYETTPDVSFPETVYFPDNPDFSNGGYFEISIKRDMYPDSADSPYYVGLFKKMY